MTSDTSTFSVSDWLTGRLPADWFTAVEVTLDREEILIDGTITAPEADSPDGQAGRITRFREDTRAKRIEIARELEERTGRKVSWAVTCGATNQVFTRLSVPVMTRLQQPQRRVLDTLVEAGVARSRSDALAWCVRLVAQHEGEWLAELEQAMGSVRTARAKGPSA
jgi:Arc/MetJ-type ribon-helix-helix transcriptional regulator